MFLGIYKAATVISFRTYAAAIVWSPVLRQRARSAVKYWVRYKADSADVAMVRVLNVAEKNDAAKSLSDIMSAGRYTKVIIFIAVSTFTPRSSHILISMFTHSPLLASRLAAGRRSASWAR